jgi:hypothetical protein
VKRELNIKRGQSKSSSSRKKYSYQIGRERNGVRRVSDRVSDEIDLMKQKDELFVCE